MKFARNMPDAGRSICGFGLLLRSSGGNRSKYRKQEDFVKELRKRTPRTRTEAESMSQWPRFGITLMSMSRGQLLWAYASEALMY